MPDTLRLLYVPPNLTLSAPFTWRVLSRNPFDAFTTPSWQLLQRKLEPECFECLPVEGGLPWHDVQPTCVVLVQLTVAPEPELTPPEKRPWQYVEAQVALVALVRV